jgi:hypothetical protein
VVAGAALPSHGIYEDQCDGRGHAQRRATWKVSGAVGSRSGHPTKGRRLSYPAETVHMGPGDNRKVKLPNVTKEEAERKWIEESLRPKGNAKKPEGKQADQAAGPASDRPDDLGMCPGLLFGATGDPLPSASSACRSTTLSEARIREAFRPLINLGTCRRPGICRSAFLPRTNWA